METVMVLAIPMMVLIGYVFYLHKTFYELYDYMRKGEGESLDKFFDLNYDSNELQRKVDALEYEVKYLKHRDDIEEYGKLLNAKSHDNSGEYVRYLGILHNRQHVELDEIISFMEKKRRLGLTVKKK